MFQDAHGLDVTAATAVAVQAFDHALMGYVSYRADIPQRMAALFEADPEFGLAHCLKGYFAMLSYKQAAVPIASCRCGCRRFTERATPREHAHIAALQAWIAADRIVPAAVWEQILDDHPRDVLAFRLAHFVNFWLGRPDSMLASVLGVGRHWSGDLPGYGAILGCRCFAHEECGYYTEAEAAAARPSIAIPAICGRRTAWRMCWRCKAAAARASTGSTVCGATGRTATICAIICSGTPRCTIWSAANRIACWRCMTPTFAIRRRS